MAGEPSNKERIPPTFGEGPIYPPPRAPAISAQPQPGAPQPTAVPRPSQQPAPQRPAPAQPPVGPIFVSDAALAPDALGRAAPLSRLSELIAHRGAQGPLAIGLLGGPGSGKTHALADIVEGAGLLATGALATPNGPFLPRISALRVDAPDLGDEPEAAIAERLHARIAREYPAVAHLAVEEAAHASSDPRQTARALAESVDAARRRVAAERQARDDAATRRARLTETVLYEAPGSQIDSYARANRGRIEPGLRAFGFSGADSTVEFKSLVHALAETGGPGNRFLASLRSLWAYKGQKKLIVLGVLFFVFAWALNLLATDRSWLGSIESGGESLKSAAGWLSAHLSAFSVGAKLADLAGVFCFVALIWRAWRFSQPLWRGAKLLDLDVAARKDDIERQIGHHAQRVEVLAREADALAQRAADAEKRAGGSNGAATAAPAFMRDGPSRTSEARAYLAALGSVVSHGEVKQAGASPSRFVIAVDSLDRLPPERGLAMLTALASALSNPAYILLVAFDPKHFASIEGSDVAIMRLIQIPFTLATTDAPGWTAFVEQLAGRTTGTPRAARTPQNGSSLDLPLAEPETKLLAALAQLAGPSPRGVHRLVNLYRLARHDAPDDLAALACHIALSIGGSADEKQAVARAVETCDPSQPFSAPEGGARVALGLGAASAAQGGPVTGASAKRAAAVGRMWSF